MPSHQMRHIDERRLIVQAVRALSYLVYFYIVAVEIILFLGFFLLLFGANPSADFVGWAYRSLERVMEPFRGIFTPIDLGTTSGDVRAVFDTSVLFAMIIYGIVGMVIHSFIRWLSYRLGYLEAAEAEQEAQAAAASAAAPAQPTATVYPTSPPPPQPASYPTTPPPPQQVPPVSPGPPYV